MTEDTSSTIAPTRLFGIFCFAAFLLSMPYGTTFLLSLLVSQHGGNEGQAGTVISAMMISTALSVILSGHLTDLLGAAKSVAAASVFLAMACGGFAVASGMGAGMLLCGLALGIGWGIFYNLGPIIVARLIDPVRRIHYFALLSGSMLTGIGTGPLIGRIVSLLNIPVEAAFAVAAAAALVGGLLFLLLDNPLRRSYIGAVPICGISFSAARNVLQSKAAFPIIMVGLGGCIFGGLSSFQTSFAATHKLDYSIFYVGFMSAAISCRLFVAGSVVRQDPLISSCVLTALIVISIVMFIEFVDSNVTYLLAAVVFGVSYGLTYSVINGIAANQAPAGQAPQALLLFSLSYLVGVFGYPLIAGTIIVHLGLSALLKITLAISIVNWGISLGRLVYPLYRCR